MVLTISPNKVSGPNNVIKTHENPNNAVPVYEHTHTHTHTHTPIKRNYRNFIKFITVTEITTNNLPPSFIPPLLPVSANLLPRNSNP